MTFNELVIQIEQYESDTFSTRGIKLTQDEAKKLAKDFIHVCVHNHLDGAWLASALEEIRE